MLKDLNIVEFADETASNSPAPGGGSIAALNASMAASLLAMVAGLTVGKKKYMDVSERMEELQTELNKYKDEFVEGIDRDANSFNGVMDAMKLPKETDEEKAYRKKMIADQKRFKKDTKLQLKYLLDLELKLQNFTTMQENLQKKEILMQSLMLQ